MELDTFLHSEQSLCAILISGVTDDILCDIGCPIMHKGVRYNCRVYCLNGRIVLIRPKMMLANDGNYREHRFFASWTGERKIEDHVLSPLLSNAMKNATHNVSANCVTVPFGKLILSMIMVYTISLTFVYPL